MMKPKEYWTDGGLRIEGRNPLELVHSDDPAWPEDDEPLDEDEEEPDDGCS